MPRGVIRSDQLNIPKPISARDIIEICRTHRIPEMKNEFVKQRLADLVNELSGWMGSEKRKPQRSSDRDKLKEAQSAIQTAAAQIQKLGPSGRQALAIVSKALGPMLSAQWINSKFPDDEYAPRRSSPPTDSQDTLRPPLRDDPRAPMYFVEEDTLASRCEFVRRRPSEVTGAVFRALVPQFDGALRALDLQPGAKGGRKKLVSRHYLIINLAEIWASAGLQVSVSKNSNFTSFCEAVAVSIGWPSEGMGSAVSKAVHEWRHLTGKSRR